MGAVSVEEMRRIERQAIAAGISEAELMRRAGEALGHAIARHFPTPGTAVGYLGKGHNAGDTLIALRVLRDRFGWVVGFRMAVARADLAPLASECFSALGAGAQLTAPPDPADRVRPLVLLDGLLGIGARGPLREPLAALAREMADLRNQHGAKIAAVDLPSGVDPDSGEIHPGAVLADITFMIAAAKRGLLDARAANATGALAMVPVALLPCPADGDIELISPATLAIGKAPRPFDFHKGTAGRVAILAGSTRYAGAAVLSALGAVRGGAGLVTLHAPTAACAAIASRLPVEAMLAPWESPRDWLDESPDAWVIGPGLGTLDLEFQSGLRTLIGSSTAATVLDADALNFLAAAAPPVPLGPQHLLTPHPGEFARLAPDLAGRSRAEAARAFADRCPATLLLKGCRTLVASHGRPLRVNSTGTPEMSNGGQGDLLAGLLGALLASGLPPFDAAALGAWLCGRAAEIHESLHGGPVTATDTARHLSHARGAWKLGI